MTQLQRSYIGKKSGQVMQPHEEWAGDFGNEYLNRNRVNWRLRHDFWLRLSVNTAARSYFEYGCNAGWNLSAIQLAYPQARVSGIDINPMAVTRAMCAGLDVQLRGPAAIASMFDGPMAELTFTAGVLIHIPPENLEGVMRGLVIASFDYVLAVEYPSISGEEEPVEYRGKTGMLWRRDYGALYEALGLKLVDKYSAHGFDRCTAYLLRKP
jgi:trans-aconitate methyltransferase